MAVFCVNTAKPLLFTVKVEFNGSCGAISVLFDEYVSNVFAIGFGVIVFFTVNKGYNISILLD